MSTPSHTRTRTSTTRSPNVLFFFTDDQRFDTIRALADEFPRAKQLSTPNLDALVRRGTTFTHAHIPGGTCPAVCMPSRAMLHSSRTLFHIDGCGERIPDEHITLGESFRNAGYETFGTGKWHNGPAAFNRSFSHGDEIFFGGMNDHWNVPAYRYDPTGRYEGRCAYVDNWELSNKVAYRACDHVHAGRHSTELFTDAAIDFLRDRDTARPFFCYVSLMAPHDPRTMPEQFRRMYDPDAIELPANFMAQHPLDTGALRIRDELLAAFPRTPAETRRHIAEYFAMISHLDAAFGRLMGTLESIGELENTIVVFAGDNGLAVGQHGLMGKQSLYDHSVRVPLVFAGPEIPRGERRDAFAYLLDIFPTLCDMTGCDIPGSVEGMSLAPVIADGRVTGRESLYLAYDKTLRGVRKDRYKLVEYAVNGHQDTQLFDLVDDPDELQNIARSDGMATVLRDLRAELYRLRDEWGDRAHATGGTFWAEHDAAMT